MRPTAQTIPRQLAPGYEAICSRHSSLQMQGPSMSVSPSPTVEQICAVRWRMTSTKIIDGSRFSPRNVHLELSAGHRMAEHGNNTLAVFQRGPFLPVKQLQRPRRLNRLGKKEQFDSLPVASASTKDYRFSDGGVGWIVAKHLTGLKATDTHDVEHRTSLRETTTPLLTLLGVLDILGHSESAYAEEIRAFNAVYGDVGVVLEVGVQLLYLGALLTLLGVGTFLVVRQVLIKRELETAAKDLQDRVRSGDASSLEYFELGAVMLRKKFYQLARKYLTEAIKKWDGSEQDLAQVHNALGFSYFSDGKTDLAIGQYEKAVKLQPMYVTAWNNLADAYESQRKYELALKAYEEALQFDPSNKIATAKRQQMKERVDRFQGIP